MSEPRAPAGSRRQLPLFEPAEAPGGDLPPPAAAPADADGAARAYAVDPRHNVVLEASAGTGKTSVLVARYVNLLAAGGDPASILAITFTRKAAAEMRERIVQELRARAERSPAGRAAWLALRDRMGDIAISTIDAFCVSLLREFPLEADVDPAFELADETEVPRLVALALDRALRTFLAVARTDADVALVLAQLGLSRTREGLGALLERRLVAREALDRFLARGPRDLTPHGVCQSAARALREVLAGVPGGLPQFLADGPSAHPRYVLFLRDAARLEQLDGAADAAVRAVLERIAGHFLTADRAARKPASTIQPYRAGHYPSKEAARRHRDAVFAVAPRVEALMVAFSRDLNVVLARGVRRMFAIALEHYRRALDERSVLDFPDVLHRALELLRQMDEFSRSRYRLEARYQHVLVDEFQDTSRAQWELISLLVQAWGHGAGLAASPTIFIVGDRKQSIYRFRDAEVAVLQQAARHIEGLRPGSTPRQSIARSFRAVPGLLHFVNDVFAEMSPRTGEDPAGASAFTYEDRDRFPVEAPGPGSPGGAHALGLVVSESPESGAAAVADEIARLLAGFDVRDKATGLARQARPGDIAILFRSRSSHRELERELGARGVPTYVYKGLGFFDADEIKDLIALLRYLADPHSDLRAAALLRSRVIRLSDGALAALAPRIASALLDDGFEAPAALDPEDARVLGHARRQVAGWLARADRVTPSELLDDILAETAYAWEIRGPRRQQAWENVKKMRALVRRMQNRGYATVPRVAEHLMSLSAGDESNAIIEAIDAVNLMTVHAAKGLEFPVVFVVNLERGASGPPRPVRLVVDGDEEPSVTVGPFLSETDELERAKEGHETRRLLYVALTRARDRLYLGATVKGPNLAPGRGSLAEVLPPSLGELFARGATALPGMDVVNWRGLSGRDYQWRLCRGSGAAAAGPPAVARSDAGEGIEDFLPPAAATGPLLVSASEWAEAGAEEDGPQRWAARSERLLGIVAHRLFQFVPRLEASIDAAVAAEWALRLLEPDELATLDDPDGFARKAADTWLRARARADVREALRGDARDFEVPFSLLTSAGGVRRLVRGTIDCLVRREDGTLAVVEFKTGGPRPAHDRQLELYVRAARALHPSATVHGVLVYV